MATATSSDRDEDRVAAATAEDHAAVLHGGLRGSVASPECAKHIRFLQQAFDAQVLNVWPEDALDSGKPVNHATLFLSGGVVYMFDAATFPTGSEPYVGGRSCGIQLTVTADSAADAHAAVANAVKAGATVSTPMKQHFWQGEGEVFGAVNDPWGFSWPIDYENPKDHAESVAKMNKQIAEIQARKRASVPVVSSSKGVAGGRD